MQYGPVVAAVDASSLDWTLYTAGVLTSAACGTTVNSAVLVVGYNNGKGTGTIPYYEVKWSRGTGWGNQGYAYIGIENGVGICGIQTESAIPAMLLASNNLQTVVIFVLLGLTLFVMIPLSFYYWRSHADKLHFMHPGQKLLQKAMYFELLYILVGLVLMCIA